MKITARVTGRGVAPGGRVGVGTTTGVGGGGTRVGVGSRGGGVGVGVGAAPGPHALALRINASRMNPHNRMFRFMAILLLKVWRTDQFKHFERNQTRKSGFA